MEQHQEGRQAPHQNEQRSNRSGAPTGFEGMNYEEQRGSYKNSDGAGANYNHEESQRERNGRSGSPE